MTRYRLIVMPLRTPKGPWRDTRREVLQDALEQQLGWRDEHEPDRIYLHALAEVEQQQD